MNVLAAGFPDPVLNAQSVFRAVLTALSRPGLIQKVVGIAGAPEALGPIGAAVLLTLADYETPLWLSPGADTQEVRGYLGFHTGAPIAEAPGRADFAFVARGDAVPSLENMRIGEDEYPDRSASVIVSVTGFCEERSLSGPGVAGAVRLGAAGLDERFWNLARNNHALYPQGVDFILAGPDGLAGLPRSTVIGA